MKTLFTLLMFATFTSLATAGRVKTMAADGADGGLIELLLTLSYCNPCATPMRSARLIPKIRC